MKNVDFDKQGTVVEGGTDFWTAEDIKTEGSIEGIFLGIISETRNIYGKETDLECPLLAFETESGGYVKKTLPSHSDLLGKLRNVKELSAVKISIIQEPIKRNDKFIYEVIDVAPDQYAVPEELINQAVSLKK